MNKEEEGHVIYALSSREKGKVQEEQFMKVAKIDSYGKRDWVRYFKMPVY